LRHEHPRVSERPFDSAWKFTHVTVAENGHPVSYVKGAPEVVLDRCVWSPEDRESWTEKAAAYAQEGFRVLALATGLGEAEDRLSWVGLVLFRDPPRPEARVSNRRVVLTTTSER
jgi:Ca2+-transporting ATPase